MPVYLGRIASVKLQVGIIVSRFNEFITRRLLEGAIETLIQGGVSREKIDTVWVPGALEIPYFCQKLAKQKKYDVLIALACVIRGETFHFECVSHELTRGISQVALSEKIPIATGVLTVDTLEQAIDRAGLKAGNKGSQAALAALEIADLNLKLSDFKKGESSSSARTATAPKATHRL